MKREYEISGLSYTQPMDGYADHSDGLNDLYVEIFEDYVTLRTERWAATPDELRALADDMEKVIKQNDQAREGNAKADKPEFLDIPAFVKRQKSSPAHASEDDA